MRVSARLLAAGAALLFIPALASAQGEKPYAGLQERRIKALSDEQVADLQAGRGMTLALAAELNGYPGPAHVLENAQALGLTPRQEVMTRSLMQTMKEEAIPLGNRLIEQEAALDQLFAAKAITFASLAAATQAIALTQSSLRQTHLKYHLSMMEVLSPKQVSQYRALRGYDTQGHSKQHHQHVPARKE